MLLQLGQGPTVLNLLMQALWGWVQPLWGKQIHLQQFITTQQVFYK